MHCDNCQSEITRKISNYYLKRNAHFFCSHDCRNEYASKNHLVTKRGIKPRNRIQLTCLYCGKQFEEQAYVLNWNRGKFCSQNCNGKYHSKEKHSCWQGGISCERDVVKHTEEYSIWRSSVYARDRWTCQICGSKKNIEAHHIARFSLFPEKRFDIDNGITLCHECHLMTYGKEDFYLPYLKCILLSVETNYARLPKGEDRVRTIQECIELDRNALVAQ